MLEGGESLSAVEEAFYQLRDFFGLSLNIAAQGAVGKGAQLLCNSVDHSGREHTVCFKDVTLPEEAVGRRHATIGQLRKS